MFNSNVYNITIDHEDGVCNIIYGALNPWFTADNLTYYKYDKEDHRFNEFHVDLRDVHTIQVTRV